MTVGSEGKLNRFSKATLEKTESEAKRLNREGPDAICLAVVLASHSEKWFEEAFGTGSIERLKDLAYHAPVVGNRETLVEFLIRAEESPKSHCALLEQDFPGLAWALAEGTPRDEQQKSILEGKGEFEAASPDSSLKELVPADLAAGLRTRVKGQDEAIDAVVRRLALTRAELDLRPHRPDGVFLFVGPTGVGKTELAKALSVEIMGSEDAMIRLDMSEYVGDWAVSRITGPMPGYSGSDKPDSWLTTRVLANPHSVILLDEIEKANPAVWNTFLQAFDDGRLTDSRGEVADFSKSIIVMTSNLGANAFVKSRVGFHTAEGNESRESRETSEMTADLRKVLPIELFNRIDSVVSFRPLDLPDIELIANAEIDRLIERLGQRNLNLTIDDEARSFVARTGYDRQLGARHLHRNIEGLLLEPLALKGLRNGNVKASLSDEAILVQEFDEQP